MMRIKSFAAEGEGPILLGWKWVRRHVALLFGIGQINALDHPYESISHFSTVLYVIAENLVDMFS